MNALRRMGRMLVAAVLAWVLILVAVQYYRAFERNVRLSEQLAQKQRDIAELREQRERSLAEIRRLSDPRGAIPEIHDRLKLVGPHEAIVYLKAASPAPSPSIAP